MATFIAIEGLDGSGKSTQIDLLIRHFQKSGTTTKFIHFPRLNEGIFGPVIAKFLRGEFGEVGDVHPQLVALLFAEDRREFAATLADWLANDYAVLVDRYVLSNIAYQCAKLTNDNERTYLRDWINRLEFEYNAIPKPDLSIYLDVPFDFVTGALEQRRRNKDRSYLNEKDDIHENDYALQRAVQREYEALCERDPSILRIRCADDNRSMRRVESIHQEIVEKLSAHRVKG